MTANIALQKRKTHAFLKPLTTNKNSCQPLAALKNLDLAGNRKPYLFAYIIRIAFFDWVMKYLREKQRHKSWITLHLRKKQVSKITEIDIISLYWYKKMNKT